MDTQENVVTELTNKNECLIQTFFRMFLGLIATAVIAFITYQTGAYIAIATSVSYSVLAIIEVVVVLVFSLAFRKLPPIAVTILYYVYAILNGVTMSVIFAVYDIGTISIAFFVTALMFGILALYGYKTKKDISKLSTIFVVGLIVGILVSIINLIIGNTIVDIIIDWFMLILFCGITAYDLNKIKNTPDYIEANQEKLYVYYAMDLYLDFINIFIRVLSILGRRKD